MSNSISNVIAVASLVEEVQVLLQFDHHSVDFHLSANTITSYVTARS